MELEIKIYTKMDKRGLIWDELVLTKYEWILAMAVELNSPQAVP